ncbi:potassium channel [Aureococcus anophagefferens]|nr:potassium channel [Aureococcus anophagefferens]
MSENRAAVIDAVGEKGYRGCYGTLSTASLASIAYGYVRHGPGPRLWPGAGPVRLAAGLAARRSASRRRRTSRPSSGPLDPGFLTAAPDLEHERAKLRPARVVLARAGIISLVVIDECDEEVGNDDSFRRSQEAQGRTIQACFALAGAKAPVVALSGTLSKFEVGSLLEALGLPPAPATLVIRTASPINSMVDIHTGEAGGEDPDGYGAPCASPLDHVAVSPPAPVTQRPVGTAFQLELARDSCEPPPTALAPRRWASAAARPIGRRCGAEILLRRQKSALVAERDGAAAELAHLCQEKVRVLKSSTAKMQDLKATIKQCNAALRKNQKDSNVVQARRKAAELRTGCAPPPPRSRGRRRRGRDPDDGIRITDGEPYYLTVTFTTVGYGDWTPKTDAGKGFAMAYARAAGFPPTSARDPFRFVGVAFLLPVVLKLGEVVVAGLNKTVLSSLASRTHRPVWPQVVVSRCSWRRRRRRRVALARTERHRRKHEGDLTFEKLCATRWDRMDAYWWAFATITTIGYGDLDAACLGGVTPMTCYVLGSVVLVAAAIANLTAALKERGEDLEERRLLEAFDVDEIMALDLDGDGVSKAEFLLGMLSAMDAVDAAKLELYASHFDELDVDRSGMLTGSKRERNSQLQRLISRPLSTRFG